MYQPSRRAWVILMVLLLEVIAFLVPRYGSSNKTTTTTSLSSYGEMIRNYHSAWTSFALRDKDDWNRNPNSSSHSNQNVTTTSHYDERNEKQQSQSQQQPQHDYIRNYMQLVLNNRSHYFPNALLLEPIQVMEQYIQQHSQQRLQYLFTMCEKQQQQQQIQQTQSSLSVNASSINSNNTIMDDPCDILHNMTFVVGHYSCPLEAGNRLMRFMNALFWAIATNRTLLWAYYDNHTCQQMVQDGDFNANLCHDEILNRMPHDCQQILQLSSWIPSYDEWIMKLNLTDRPIRTCVTGAKVQDTHENAIPMDGPNVPRVIRIGQQTGLTTPISLTGLWERRRFLSQEQNIDIVWKLLIPRGIYFTYGMFFESLFTLHDSLFQPPIIITSSNIENNNSSSSSSSTNSTITNSTATTVATMLDKDIFQNADTYLLHSRHQFAHDDGSYIGMDVSCMKKMLSHRTNPTSTTTTTTNTVVNNTTTSTIHNNNTNTTTTTTTTKPKPCFVFIMTDRQRTRDLLPSALAVFHCTAVLLANPNPGISFHSEHGPFAGRGYFQDVLFVIQHVRQGMMSPNKRIRPKKGLRTSSALPRSIIEFRRLLELTTTLSTSATSMSRQEIPKFDECFQF